MSSLPRLAISPRRVLICSCFLLLFHSVPFSTCEGSSPQSEYNKIQREIRTQREKLERAKKRESSILSEIEDASRQMKAIDNELRKYRTRLMNTEVRISQVEREISASMSAIERHRQWMKRKLRTIHRYGRNSDAALLLLGAQDIPQLIRTGKSLQHIAAHEHKRMRTYQETLTGLQAKEKQLAILRRELMAQKSKVHAEEASLALARKQKEATLASVKKEKSSYAKMLSEMEKSSKKLLEIIRKSETAETPLSGRFAGLKGRLPWPVDGRVIIPYGAQKDPQFNTPVFRSGTFIESHADSGARAVHEGKVVFAEWFKGYGQLVIINHGEGYHSLYGSLSEIFTGVGDIIKEKQIIGRVGNSGLVDLPGLYFELRYKGKPLNPMQWLKRK